MEERVKRRPARRMGVLIMLVMVAPTAPAGGGALGLDIGGSDSVVALARRGGVDIVANEATRRQTPTVVAFGSRRRWVGEGAMPQRTTDPPNAVAETKQLLGRKLTTLDLSGMGITHAPRPHPTHCHAPPLACP